MIKTINKLGTEPFLKKKEILLYATAYMNLEDITLSEIR